MSVYVDSAIWPYRGMVMCHMFADSTDELVAMTERVGAPRGLLQKAGAPEEHIDICKSKRALAVRYGAMQISRRAVVALVRGRRLREAGVSAK